LPSRTTGSSRLAIFIVRCVTAIALSIGDNFQPVDVVSRVIVGLLWSKSTGGKQPDAAHICAVAFEPRDIKISVTTGLTMQGVDIGGDRLRFWIFASGASVDSVVRSSGCGRGGLWRSQSQPHKGQRRRPATRIYKGVCGNPSRQAQYTAAMRTGGQADRRQRSFGLARKRRAEVLRVVFMKSVYPIGRFPHKSVTFISLPTKCKSIFSR
jgi:hypothetical protein